MSSGLPLDQLGRDISVRLQRADDYMIGACTHLAEARERVLVKKEAGKITWGEWCQKNILKKDGTPFSMSYLRKQLVIGKASDHQAALDERRAETRKSVARVREKEKQEAILRRSAPATPIAAVLCALRDPGEAVVEADPAEAAVPEDARQDAAAAVPELVEADLPDDESFAEPPAIHLTDDDCVEAIADALTTMISPRRLRFIADRIANGPSGARIFLAACRKAAGDAADDDAPTAAAPAAVPPASKGSAGWRQEAF